MTDWLESRSPAFIAAGIGMLAGVCMFGYGVYGLFAVEPLAGPLAVALMLCGGLEWLFCFLAVRRNRIGWAFALSMNGVGAAIFLFGAPKVRDGFETNLAIGLLPFLAFFAITVLFALSSDEYQ